MSELFRKNPDSAGQRRLVNKARSVKCIVFYSVHLDYMTAIKLCIFTLKSNPRKKSNSIPDAIDKAKDFSRALLHGGGSNNGVMPARSSVISCPAGNDLVY